jgi:WD40 repeat protein
MLASGGNDGRVMVWDVNKQDSILVNEDEVSKVTKLVWNQEGTKLAAAFASGRITVTRKATLR